MVAFTFFFFEDSKNCANHSNNNKGGDKEVREGSQDVEDNNGDQQPSISKIVHNPPGKPYSMIPLSSSNS